MKIDIMGVHYGHIGGMFRSAAQAKNGAIVGLVEPDDSLYEKYMANQSIPRYASLEDLLEKARPDLVLEGLTHPEKAPAIETCAQAGVHMLLDKPLCSNEADYQRIKTAVETAQSGSLCPKRRRIFTDRGIKNNGSRICGCRLQ